MDFLGNLMLPARGRIAIQELTGFWMCALTGSPILSKNFACGNTVGVISWKYNGGCIHGETDEHGRTAVTDVVNHFDYHATLMYLLGYSFQSLTLTV
jgi:hypothetical protein